MSKFVEKSLKNYDPTFRLLLFLTSEKKEPKRESQDHNQRLVCGLGLISYHDYHNKMKISQ